MIAPETIARIRALLTEVGITEADLQESFILGGGPGGQKVNKTSHVVRLVHKPSRLAVKCDETRSRETNRWLARRKLANALIEMTTGQKSAEQQEREKIRRQKRRRSRRQRARMLADKRFHSAIKQNRRPVIND